MTLMHSPKIMVFYDIEEDAYVLEYDHLRILLPWQLAVQLRNQLNQIDFPFSHAKDEQSHRAETDLNVYSKGDL